MIQWTYRDKQESLNGDKYRLITPLLTQQTKIGWESDVPYKLKPKILRLGQVKSIFIPKMSTSNQNVRTIANKLYFEG